MARKFALFLLLAAVLSWPATAEPHEIAPGVLLLPGQFIEGSQPDGNSVIFVARDGLVVVDTGRHRSHTQALLDFAKSRKKKISGVINTHWHLDHVGGNLMIRRAFPNVRIYATSALSGAMNGFLARYATQLQEMISNSPSGSEEGQRFRDELNLIEAGPRLAPNEVITRTSHRKIAGRKVLVNVERNAVTEGDLWILDPASETLVVGDLITLPFPFFDTACPRRWKESLDNVAMARFKRIVPGHGPVMDRQAFEMYRSAFGKLLWCAASESPAEECTERWLRDAGDLLSEQEQKLARDLAGYYLNNILRASPERSAELCGG